MAQTVDLAVECGFTRRYRASTGTVEDGDVQITDIFQVEDDTTAWRMVGSLEGVYFGLDVQPRGCSGDLRGLWWGDGLLLALDFEGTMTEESVEFSTFRIISANSHSYDGIMHLAPYPYRPHG